MGVGKMGALFGRNPGSQKEDVDSYIATRLAELAVQEKRAMESHKQLSRDQHTWRKEKARLEADVSKLKATREQLEQDYAKKLLELRATESAVLKENEALREDKKLLLEKEQEILSKSKDMSKLRRLVAEVDQKQAGAAARERVLKEREQIPTHPAQPLQQPH